VEGADSIRWHYRGGEAKKIKGLAGSGQRRPGSKVFFVITPTVGVKEDVCAAACEMN